MSEEGLLHPIKVAALKAGLSPHLIRVWERRYGAVNPERTESRRRMYSEREIERLKLLGTLTSAGHSIGNIANLDVDSLRNMTTDRAAIAAPDPRDQMHSDRQQAGRRFIHQAINAVAGLNQESLEKSLQDAAVELGQQGVLLHVVAPLAEEVGRLWEKGSIGVAHEHFATAVLRTFLGNMSRPFAPNTSAPHIVTATPTAQLHEMGAMIITAAAVAMGWQATFLGAGISPLEIAGALKQKPARVVGLSIVYPPDDPGVAREIEQLGELLPETVRFMIGGRSARSYQAAIDKAGAILTGPLDDFIEHLKQVREMSADEV